MPTTSPTNRPEEIVFAPLTHDEAARWQPVEGPEVLMLLAQLRLDNEGTRNVKAEAMRVLSRCVPPTVDAGSETGLVIGYVQSGKTMSITAVAALARDNGFRLVIVITGISKPLFEQSTERLLRDLQIRTRPDRKWKHFPNPRVRGTSRAAIQDTLDEWNDSTVPENERQTVLVTVMKNHTHLRNLNEVIGHLNLEKVPALVIDDEADQASLNTLVNQQNKSTTYSHLLALKSQLPQHSFLQYTATPQAPLLINLIDALSPNFAEVLKPGAAYVGGQEFFVRRRQDLVRLIPAVELPAAGNTLTAPPDSLLEAMRLFFLGIAAGLVVDKGQGNRSMLVHPHQETQRHTEYFQWVRSAKTNWQGVFALADTNPDKRDVLEEFASSYNDLQSTVADIPSFATLVARLPQAFRKTVELEVNARRGQTPRINWHDTYAHILVGGQAMDRGFTVEGLTVTYMPRVVGVGNADTFQQRARFFGYKRSYLGYCRVFLENDAADAYRRYVTHEEDIRTQIEALRGRGATLDSWKREFLLTQRLQPTRDNVLDLPYMRFRFTEWYYPKVPHEAREVTEANRKSVSMFIGKNEFSPDGGDERRTEMQRHIVAVALPLRRVYEDLLTEYRITRPSESQRYTNLLLQLQVFMADKPNATCTVYVMHRALSDKTTRARPVNADNELSSYLFQGEHPAAGRKVARGSIYPGDVHLPCGDDVHVQIHHLRLRRGDEVVEDDVPTIAIKLPDGIDDIIVQPQGGAS